MFGLAPFLPLCPPAPSFLSRPSSAIIDRRFHERSTAVCSRGPRWKSIGRRGFSGTKPFEFVSSLFFFFFRSSERDSTRGPSVLEKGSSLFRSLQIIIEALKFKDTRVSRSNGTVGGRWENFPAARDGFLRNSITARFRWLP